MNIRDLFVPPTSDDLSRQKSAKQLVEDFDQLAKDLRRERKVKHQQARRDRAARDQKASDRDLRDRIDRAEIWIHLMSRRKGIPIREAYLYCLFKLLDNLDFAKLVQDRMHLSDDDVRTAHSKVFAYCEPGYVFPDEDSYRLDALDLAVARQKATKLQQKNPTQHKAKR